MSVRADLQLIADNASRELDAVHDFFEHSKVVWQSFKILVDEGRTITSANLATGTTIDQAGLLALAPQYTRNYLARFTFRQFVSAFEVFLFDFLHRLLLHYTWQFSKSELPFDTDFRDDDREEIILRVILKPLVGVMYI